MRSPLESCISVASRSIARTCGAPFLLEQVSQSFEWAQRVLGTVKHDEPDGSAESGAHDSWEQESEVRAIELVTTERN